MTQQFSKEFTGLVSAARDMAIGLGFDHITTVHFFLADCLFNKTDSIRHFAFSEDADFEQFKKEYTIDEGVHLEMLDYSLPLTVEAEETIKLAIAEMKQRKQKAVYPCHFFIAALKNKQSILSECFRDEAVLQQLEIFYTERESFQQGITAEENDASKKSGVVRGFSKLFGKK